MRQLLRGGAGKLVKPEDQLIFFFFIFWQYFGSTASTKSFLWGQAYISALFTLQFFSPSDQPYFSGELGTLQISTDTASFLAVPFIASPLSLIKNHGCFSCPIRSIDQVQMWLHTISSLLGQKSWFVESWKYLEEVWSDLMIWLADRSVTKKKKWNICKKCQGNCGSDRPPSL